MRRGGMPARANDGKLPGHWLSAAPEPAGRSPKQQLLCQFPIQRRASAAAQMGGAWGGESVDQGARTRMTRQEALALRRALLVVPEGLAQLLLGLWLAPARWISAQRGDRTPCRHLGGGALGAVGGLARVPGRRPLATIMAAHRPLGRSTVSGRGERCLLHLTRLTTPTERPRDASALQRLMNRPGIPWHAWHHSC
jgi:hypothetical protein